MSSPPLGSELVVWFGSCRDGDRGRDHAVAERAAEARRMVSTVGGEVGKLPGHL